MDERFRMHMKAVPDRFGTHGCTPDRRGPHTVPVAGTVVAARERQQPRVTDVRRDGLRRARDTSTRRRWRNDATPCGAGRVSDTHRRCAGAKPAAATTNGQLASGDGRADPVWRVPPRRTGAHTRGAGRRRPGTPRADTAAPAAAAAACQRGANTVGSTAWVQTRWRCSWAVTHVPRMKP